MDESDSLYSEKKWNNCGKDVDNDDMIDGYVFRGKNVFSQALEGLKDIMKKGIVNEIGNIKFKALDRRVQGAGLEMDVEIVENKSRGVSLLKLYGPSTKKEYVVTLSKSKASDSKFVIILASPNLLT